MAVEGDGWHAYWDSIVYKKYENEGYPEEQTTAVPVPLKNVGEVLLLV